jgi:uncharacterized protein (TIGR01244 family)
MTMSTTRLSEDFHICGQIGEHQLAEIAAMGFRSLICNRPDGEQPGQPASHAMEAAARAAGLDFRYIPVVPGRAGRAEADAMAQALREMDGPVLAYCRSGARAASLYQAARAHHG